MLKITQDRYKPMEVSDNKYINKERRIVYPTRIIDEEGNVTQVQATIPFRGVYFIGGRDTYKTDWEGDMNISINKSGEVQLQTCGDVILTIQWYDGVIEYLKALIKENTFYTDRSFIISSNNIFDFTDVVIEWRSSLFCRKSAFIVDGEVKEKNSNIITVSDFIFSNDPTRDFINFMFPNGLCNIFYRSKADRYREYRIL